MSENPLVLVVDDEPGIRMCAADILEANGFTAITADSADEAVVILENRHEISLVVTDIVMTGTLDGLGLVSEIRRRWPRLDVIVASGRMPAEAAANASRTVFLSKPFDEHGLIAAIAEAQSSHV